MHEFETNFKSDAYLEFTVDHLELPIFAVGIYLGMIQYVPDNLSKPWSVRTSWGLWNLLLSVFSMVGASRCIPKLLATFEDKGFTYTVCGGEGPYPPTPDDAYDVVKYPHYLSNWYTTGPSGLWVFLFIYSKLPELLDTAFLVFQKKPVIFLHWFHHVTVLLYCWHAYHHQVSSGLWFASMNYFVHSIMYLYYFVMIIPSKSMFPIRNAAKVAAPLITTIQILQMVGGIVVTVWGAWQTYFHPQKCSINAANYRLGLAMYTSYFALFLRLFVGKFCSCKRKTASREDDPKEICNANVTGDTAGFFHGKAMWARQWSPRGRNKEAGLSRSPSPSASSRKRN